MSKKNQSYGDKVRDRAKCLLTVFLARDIEESETLKRSSFSNGDQLFTTTTKDLVKLANEYYKYPDYEYAKEDEFNDSKILEAVNNLKGLGILDKPDKTQGVRKQIYTLKQSLINEKEYLANFNLKWDDTYKKSKGVEEPSQQSPNDAPRPLKPGKYSLKCLGHIPNEKAQFLNGMTISAQVNLAPMVGGNFSGTIWEITYDEAASAYRFKCCGHLEGSRFLNGLTAEARPRVNLVPSAGDEFSGINWRAVTVSDESTFVFRFECLSKKEGPRWLDGRTIDATVALVDVNFTGNSGTKWQVEPVEPASTSIDSNTE